MDARHRRIRGFTLVELLVVVAIIALLVSIMLPGLGAARTRAKRLRCTSNLRQIAYAWTCYLDHEANGIFPIFQKNIHWFYGGKNLGADYEYPETTLEPRPLNIYLGADPYGNEVAEVFHCPADSGMRHDREPKYNWPSTYDRYGNSYPVNGKVFPLKPPPRRLNQIRVPPSIFILVGDHASYWAPRRTPYQTFWHDDQGLAMNIGFMDGHAEFMKFERDVEQTGHYSFDFDWLPPEQP